MKNIKLFCFPYAGGSATIYNNWNQYLDDSIELRPIELAGRGKRFKEDLYKNLSEAIDDIYNLIKEELDVQYAFYGHSMGSMLAYELYYKLRQLDHTEPEHIFFSGKEPPGVKENDDQIHQLPEKEFKEEIIRRGNIPEKLLKEKELLDIFLPILRADYRLVETYNYIPKSKKIDCDITALAGEQEEFSAETIYEWNRFTNRKCNVYIYKGDHFFLHDNMKKIVQMINTILINRRISNLTGEGVE